MRKTLAALGLKHRNDQVIHKNTHVVNGMLRKVMICIDVKVIIDAIYKIFRMFCEYTCNSLVVASLLCKFLMFYLAGDV